MLTEVIENLLNRNLGSSPRARELCGELIGQVLHVDITGTPWQVTIESLGRSLRLGHSWRPHQAFDNTLSHGSTAAAAQPDRKPPAASVRGSAINLLALAGGDPQDVIRRGAVRIDGDAEVAQRYQDLLRFLRPDVEEELSKLLGDSPAHQLMRVAKLAVGFGKRAVNTTVRNTAEYLAHESADLVPRAEADQFLNGVAQLRESADRLEARIAVMEAKREAKPA